MAAEAAQVVAEPETDPLEAECQRFLEWVVTRAPLAEPGDPAGLVTGLADLCGHALAEPGPAEPQEDDDAEDWGIHPAACLDQPRVIGERTQIGPFACVGRGATIGDDCRIAPGALIGPGAVVGHRVRIGSHVELCRGVVIEDDVVCGPGVRFTRHSRVWSEPALVRRHRDIVVKRGARLDASAVVAPGCTIGEYALILAGSFVTSHVPRQAIVAGSPAEPLGWICRCGRGRLKFKDASAETCRLCGVRYRMSNGLIEDQVV